MIYYVRWYGMIRGRDRLHHDDHGDRDGPPEGGGQGGLPLRDERSGSGPGAHHIVDNTIGLFRAKLRSSLNKPIV